MHVKELCLSVRQSRPNETVPWLHRLIKMSKKYFPTATLTLTLTHSGVRGAERGNITHTIDAVYKQLYAFTHRGLALVLLRRACHAMTQSMTHCCRNNTRYGAYGTSNVREIVDANKDHARQSSSLRLCISNAHSDNSRNDECTAVDPVQSYQLVAVTAGKGKRERVGVGGTLDPSFPPSPSLRVFLYIGRATLRLSPGMINTQHYIKHVCVCVCWSVGW